MHVYGLWTLVVVETSLMSRSPETTHKSTAPNVRERKYHPLIIFQWEIPLLVVIAVDAVILFAPGT